MLSHPGRLLTGVGPILHPSSAPPPPLQTPSDSRLPVAHKLSNPGFVSPHCPLRTSGPAAAQSPLHLPPPPPPVLPHPAFSGPPWVWVHITCEPPCLAQLQQSLPPMTCFSLTPVTFMSHPAAQLHTPHQKGLTHTKPNCTNSLTSLSRAGFLSTCLVSCSQPPRSPCCLPCILASGSDPTVCVGCALKSPFCRHGSQVDHLLPQEVSH